MVHLKHQHEQELALMQQQVIGKEAALQELRSRRDAMLAAANDAPHMYVLQSVALVFSCLTTSASAH